MTSKIIEYSNFSFLPLWHPVVMFILVYLSAWFLTCTLVISATKCWKQYFPSRIPNDSCKVKYGNIDKKLIYKCICINYITAFYTRKMECQMENQVYILTQSMSPYWTNTTILFAFSIVHRRDFILWVPCIISSKPMKLVQNVNLIYVDAFSSFIY